MSIFYNPHPHVIQLSGPNKEIIKIQPKTQCELPEWFIKYCPKYLHLIKHTYAKQIKNSEMIMNYKHPPKTPTKTIVGTKSNKSTYEPYIPNISISNDIGIGILSYNRPQSLLRLLNSIEKHTDTTRTTIFVSDESDNSEIYDMLKSKPWIITWKNTERLGIAGNSNRLLLCLSRFKYKLLLNDDVEILQPGWDSYYFNIMKFTSIHHFCFREYNIYGAVQNENISYINNYQIKTIYEKPQGAVLAFDDTAFNTVGYFDPIFGNYGMEHVDWSNRINLSKIQIPGFHDTSDSNRYFKIHPETSSINNTERITNLTQSKDIYKTLKDNTKRIYIPLPNNIDIPSLSYIIPTRITDDRTMPIKTVINNIKAQKFPNIQIIVIEHDVNSKLPSQCTQLINDNKEFNKSWAFNVGATNALYEKMILHDGDILILNNYSYLMYDYLNQYESCHIGDTVFYFDSNSTNKITQTQKIDNTLKCERTVGYFEGGSLGCNKNTYIKIGGFCEDFWGYGCEDCEFFNRLKLCTNMHNKRSEIFLHLWHGRASLWNDHHDKNKALFNTMISDTTDTRIDKLHKYLIKKYDFINTIL